MSDKERAIELLEDNQIYMQGDPTEWAYALAITALSRTRIRETATEPPKYEDTSESGSGRWDVLAYNKRDEEWITSDYVAVDLNPKAYPLWTQLPEVTDLSLEADDD